MRTTISKRLAPLASLAARRRYIVHGTREEYLVPSQLLNDADDVIRQVPTMPAARDSLSADAVQVVLDLDGLLGASPPWLQESALRTKQAVPIDPDPKPRRR